MCFVRKASNYSEQNLFLSQQGNSLYYTTTTNILPKQELLVRITRTYFRISFLTNIVNYRWATALRMQGNIIYQC